MDNLAVFLNAQRFLRHAVSHSDGGPGSGNWGHSGRPGIRGGSGPGGGLAYRASIAGTFISKTNQKGKQEKLNTAISKILGAYSEIGNVSQYEHAVDDFSKVIGCLQVGDKIIYPGVNPLKATVLAKNKDGTFDMEMPYGEAASYSAHDIADDVLWGIKSGDGVTVELNSKKPKPIKDDQKKALENEKRDDEDYTQDRKDNALWDESMEEVHNRLIGDAGKVWNESSYDEKKAVYDYTNSGYISMNDELYSGKYSKGETEEYTADRINNATSFMNKTSLPEDTWTERGCGGHGAAALGVSDALLDKVSSGDKDALEELRATIIGTTKTQDGFLSTAPHKGKGWGGDVTLNMYVPKGSHACYVEPFSGHGQGKEMAWDRLDGKNYNTNGNFGEFELLVQRGAQLKFTKVEVNAWGKIFVDCEVYTPTMKAAS